MPGAPPALSAEPKIQTAFRLSSTDFELLDLIRARYCLSNRTAALRFVLRWWKAQVSKADEGA